MLTHPSAISFYNRYKNHRVAEDCDFRFLCVRQMKMFSVRCFNIYRAEMFCFKEKTHQNPVSINL